METPKENYKRKPKGRTGGMMLNIKTKEIIVNVENRRNIKKTEEIILKKSKEKFQGPGYEKKI